MAVDSPYPRKVPGVVVFVMVSHCFGRPCARNHVKRAVHIRITVPVQIRSVQFRFGILYYS
eukprot:8213684-Heterocapsa_arctica.AAC.1